MDDQTQQQLSDELAELRQRMAELESREARLRHAEQALQRDRERWKAFIEQADDLIFTLNPAGQITSVNQAISTVLGYTAEQVLGKNPLEFIAPSARASAALMLAQVLSGQDVEQAEMEAITQDGRHVTLEVRGRILFQDGQIVETFHIARDITERKRVEQAERDQRALAEALRDTAAALSATLDFEQVLDRILISIGRVVPHDACSVFLIDLKSGIARVARNRGYVEQGVLEPVSALRFTVMEVPSLRRMAETGQPMAIPDTKADPNWIDWEATRWIRSYAGAPIRIRGQAIGFLNLDSATPNFYSQAHAERLRAFADQAAIAIENASLYAEAEQRAESMQVLNEIGQALASTLGLPLLYRLIYQQVSRVLRVDAFYVALYNEAQDELYFPFCYDDGQFLAPQTWPLGQGPASHVIRTGTAFLVNHPGDPIQASESPFGNARQSRASAMHVPMLAGDRIVGVISAQSYQAEAYGSEDLQVLEVIAHQAAVAIENARLYQDTLDERTYLQALIESSRDGIMLIGMDIHILVINAPALRLLGLPDQPEDWRGRPLRDVLDRVRDSAPDVVQVVLEEIRRMRKGDEPPGEGEIEMPPHTFHWLNLPVLVGETPLGRLIVYRDVTDERAVERLREDMTHMMVHDLRNPLGAILTALELVNIEADDSLSAEQQRELDIAVHQAIKMQGLVNRILDVNQLESGRMPLHCAPIRLNELIAEVVYSQASLASARGLHLESVVPSHLPPAWADAELIGHVLQNLLDNALKFTPPGGTIRVAVREQESKPRAMLLVSVSDTGSGIPDEVTSHLFDKFVRGRQKAHGSGLGLAYCKLAMEAHGGRIWVENTPDSGTTFTFSLEAAGPSTQAD